MTTLEMPVRERIEAEAAEARDALEHVVVRATFGSGKSHVYVRNAVAHGATAIPEAVDWPTQRWDSYRRVRSAIRKLVEDAGRRDSELARELLDMTLELQERLEQDPDGTDPGWKVREVADQIVDLLLMIQRESEHNVLDDPAAAARYVIDQLPGVDQEELAALLGVDARTIRDWKSQKTKTIRKHPERVTLVAQLVYDLRRAMTPRGVVMWFKRGRPQLNGQTPLELINTDADMAAESLRPLARGVRGQLGT